MKKVWQFIKFVMVGVSNTLISEVVYAILVVFHCNYLVASCIGFVVSIFNAYYWNNKYVFKEDKDKAKRVWWKVLLKTFVAYLWGFILNLILLMVWVEVIHIADYMVPVEEFLVEHGITAFDAKVLGNLLAEGINLLIVLPINYVINKYWAYKQEK